MSLEIVVTNLGRAAIVNAQNNGTAPVTIAEIGLSATAIAPVQGATALAGEFKRVATLSGEVVADDTIHVTMLDTSNDAYTLRSFALYLADGTLFALYGQAAAVLEKTASSIPALSIDVIFADISAASLTFGNAEFINPPATETTQGVAGVATQAESDAGIDDVRIVTPKKNRASFLSWLASALPTDLWRASNDGAGSGLDADLLDGQQGSWYTAIAARLGFTPVNKAGDTMTGNLIISSTNPILHLQGDPVNSYYPELRYTSVGHISSIRGYGGLFHDTSGAHLFRINSVEVFRLVPTGATRAGNTVWDAGNDGAGSGLDADLLDGKQGNAYALLDGAAFTSTVSAPNFDGALRGPHRFTDNRSVADTPTGLVGQALTLDFKNASAAGSPPVSTGGSYSYILNVAGWAISAGILPSQIAVGDGLALRQATSTTAWGAWRTFWHDGNDGAGSALDADLLDGQQGSWYSNIIARLGFSPLNKAGDTMTGPLVLSGAPSNNLHPATKQYTDALVTAAALLAKMVTVDGAGSGLDADLLDGHQAAVFDRVVEQNLTANGGYIIYASGRKECWGTVSVAQDSYVTWNLPIPHSSWVHPSMAVTGKAGNNTTADNTMIANFIGAPPTAIRFWNAEDTTLTIYVRTVGV